MCEEAGNMSSAYLVIVVPGGGGGRSDVYMLKRIGDNTPPWGTPDLNCCFMELEFWYVV